MQARQVEPGSARLVHPCRTDSELSENVQALVGGHTDAGLVPVTKLVVLANLDIESRSPIASCCIEVPPYIAQLQVRPILAASAAERELGSCKTVDPRKEKLPAAVGVLTTSPPLFPLPGKVFSQ